MEYEGNGLNSDGRATKPDEAGKHGRCYVQKEPAERWSSWSPELGSDICSGCWTQGKEMHSSPRSHGNRREIGSDLPYPWVP